jgi:hypothetical protein
MMAVIPIPMSGSAIGRPIATTAALAMTASETYESTRQRHKVRRRLLVDQPRDGLDPRDASRGEDRPDDEQPGEALRTLRPKQERNRQGDRRRGVPEVVDQIGQQGDASAGDEDCELSGRREAEHGE